MKFGVFYEHQLPRPWNDGDERRLFRDALEQAELADRLGFDCFWEVEHHFLEEYSHSSAPEVFLAAVSQRTRRIRLGHGIVQTPPPFNHPVRVAERIATLDLVSDGRVEFGSGEASSEMELGGFDIPRAEKRAMWEEGLTTALRAMVEDPFRGQEGRYVKVPPRNVVPKPVQKPHPPLWVACSRRETIHMAGERGMGALGFSFIDADEARRWVDGYYERLADADPIGFSINPNIAIVTGFMCCRDEQEALDKGLDGAHFFAYSLGHYYFHGQHNLGTPRTNVWEDFLRNREAMGFGKITAGGRRIRAKEEAPDAAPDAGRIMRGAVGTPEQIRDFLRGYEEAGIDQVIFISQGGKNRHEDICESMELFSREVMPEFVEREEKREREKARRLEPVVERAAKRIEARGEPPEVDLVVPASSEL